MRNQEPWYWRIEENGRGKARTEGESKGRRGESIAAKRGGCGGCAEAAWDREGGVSIVRVRGWLEWKTQSYCQSPNTSSTASHPSSFRSQFQWIHTAF